MEKNILLFLFIAFTFVGKAQQWISKDYSYDSIPNIKYGTAVNFNGGTDTLKMDVYAPICSDLTTRRPLMLIIHGGSFLAGTRYDANIIRLTRDFAKRGYVTATIEYRLGFISDDNAWTCNFPNYSCVFATDSAEWYRSAYRAIQDAKGALRYLVNRNQQYRIDTNCVFVSGESAGGFIALGVAYMDTLIEKPLVAGLITAAPPPNLSAQNCSFNIGKTFTTSAIARPDLGSIDGSLEPTSINYKIKGVGDFYGGVFNDIFKYTKAGTTPPALYLFQQPCDLIVPFTIGKVETGFSWCMTNCYSCYGIANTPFVSGCKAIKNNITSNGYPITIYDDMTSNLNPNNCLIGQWSCADQINNPCHGIDNYNVRTNNLATFFAGKITTSPVCLPGTAGIKNENKFKADIQLAPNPFTKEIVLTNNSRSRLKYKLTDVSGNNLDGGELSPGTTQLPFKNSLERGIYFITISNETYSAVYKVVCIGE